MEFFNIPVVSENKGVRKGDWALTHPPLQLDVVKNFITCANEINCFSILFAC